MGKVVFSITSITEDGAEVSMSEFEEDIGYLDVHSVHIQTSATIFSCLGNRYRWLRLLGIPTSQVIPVVIDVTLVSNNDEKEMGNADQ